MSMQPNNPFEANQPDQAAEGPPKKSKAWIWILGIVGGIGVVGAIVCCGVGYWGFSMATGFLAESYKETLAGNPVMTEHIGEDFSIEMNLMRTGKEQQEMGDDSVQAFDVSGSNGSGILVVTPDPTAPGNITSAELVMPDGTRHQIQVDQFDDMNDLDMDIDMGDIESGLPEIEAVQP